MLIVLVKMVATYTVKVDAEKGKGEGRRGEPEVQEEKE